MDPCQRIRVFLKLAVEPAENLEIKRDKQMIMR